MKVNTQQYIRYLIRLDKKYNTYQKLWAKKLKKCLSTLSKKYKLYNKSYIKSQKNAFKRLKASVKGHNKNLKYCLRKYNKQLKKLLRVFTPAVQMEIYLTSAAVLLVLGLVVILKDIQINNQTNYRLAKLIYKANHGGATSAIPSTVKPTTTLAAQTSVQSSLPSYLVIPKIAVDARVYPVGLDSTGALETPTNVFDTAWYNQSALPGNPGATLIDGHISSWTSQGVFYNLKLLLPGDGISIQRSDGKTINYTVIKSQVYAASNVDMNAAVTSVEPNKSGLNLISCDGSVVSGTNDFNERIIVFAVEV